MFEIYPLDLPIGFFMLAGTVVLSIIHHGFLRIIHRIGKHAHDASEEVPVSVIIAAKNEANNLLCYLPKILAQTYGQYEVIVVDDHSEDETHEVLEKMQETNDHLRFTKLTEGAGKKRALTQGILMAKNNWLLFTDADCAPRSDEWIKGMMSQVTPHSALILGYSPLIKSSGMVNTMARVDTFNIAINYLAAAMYGRPYMGVGRNLAYTKELFTKVGGFAEHLEILSGDDDLFVQASDSAHNTLVVMETNAQTNSASKTTWAAWFAQKRRHTSTGLHYSYRSLLFLGLIQLNTLVFYSMVFYNLITGDFLIVTLVFVIIRSYSQYSVLKKYALKLGEMDLLLLSLLLEFPLMIFNLLAGVSNILFKNKRWS